MPTPLHRFFQQNYDSTIIYHSSSGRYAPHYLILARQHNRVYFFTYTSPYRGLAGIYYPGRLTHSLARQELLFRLTPPDTNRYLLPRRVPPATLSQYWRLLQPARLWNIQDDRQTLTPTATCSGPDDGDENTFYFISKQTIRTAFFYAPAYWQECQGQEPNRAQAIEARMVLRRLLSLEQIQE